MEKAATRNATLRFREAELLQLVRSTQSDRGSVVMLNGRLGSGKAQLINALCDQVEARVFSAHTPSHSRFGAGRSPFVEIVRQALDWADSHRLTELLVDPIYADIAPILTEPAPQTEASEAPSLDQKLRFFEATRRLLSEIYSRERLIVVVYDLELADRDTLELAGYLADELFADPGPEHGLPPSGLLALLVRNDLSRSSVDAFIQDLSERPSVQSLELGGLPLEELRRYVGGHALLERLHAASGGLPQRVDALLEQLPTNVETLFERKLQNFSSAMLRPLNAMVVLERAASVRTLAEITRMPQPEVARALAELREGRVVQRSIHEGEFRFAFCRRGDQEIAQRMIASEEQRRLHGACAELFGKNGDSPARIAHHLLRSSEPQRGVPVAIRAAEQHALTGSFDAAVSMLEEARSHAQGELLRTILERLVELAPLAGHPKRALRYACALKQSLPPNKKFGALIREAELRNAIGDHELALEVLHEAQAEQPAQRARLFACTGEAHYQLGQLPQAKRCAESGITQAQQPKRTIELLNLLGKIALSQDEPEEAIARFEQTLACARRSGLGAEEARALINLGVVLLRRDHTEKTEAYLFEGIELARQGHELSLLAMGTLSAGAYLYKRSELGRSIEAYRESKRLFRRLGNRTQLARALHNLGILYLVCGDLARARTYNEEGIRLARQGGAEQILASGLMLEGSILGELGEHERGETQLREGMLLRRKLGVERPLEAMIELGELYLLAGDSQKIQMILEEIEQVLPTLDSELLRARVSLLEGRVRAGTPKAQGLLVEARATFEQLDRKLWARDADVALGQHYHRVGRPESAKMHLLSAQKWQQTVAASLPEQLRASFERARPQRAVFEALSALQTERRVAQPKLSSEPKHPEIIGRSKKLGRVFKIIDRVAPSESTVLIHGESGTGKELVAEAIHKSSPRSSGPFVKLNCAALVESLLLSELFGHERGSFTGAHQRKIGRFEMAAGGTLFLDEIGDISPKTQVSLLRVLQEREFERVGGGKPIKVQARIIVATNKNLAQMVQEGTFREDLYYRLKGLTVDLPPLRDRPEDIELLTAHFLQRYATESGTTLKRMDEAALHLMKGHAWPGNIRELENVVRSVALFTEGSTITQDELQEHSELGQSAPAPTPVSAVQDSGAFLSEIFDRGATLAELKLKIQKEAIKRAIGLHKGNITRAAESLGMKRPRLSQIINSDVELKQLCQEVSR